MLKRWKKWWTCIYFWFVIFKSIQHMWKEEWKKWKKKSDNVCVSLRPTRKKKTPLWQISWAGPSWRRWWAPAPRWCVPVAAWPGCWCTWCPSAPSLPQSPSSEDGCGWNEPQSKWTGGKTGTTLWFQRRRSSSQQRRQELQPRTGTGTTGSWVFRTLAAVTDLYKDA